MTDTITDEEIILACANPDTALSLLVANILTGKRGHTGLVELVFRMAAMIARHEKFLVSHGIKEPS